MAITPTAPVKPAVPASKPTEPNGPRPAERNVNATAVATGKQGENAPAEKAKPAKPVVATSFISAPVMLADDADMIKASAPRNARSEEQRAMDTVTRDLHAKWVKAAKPTKWADAVTAKVVATYFVNPDQVSTLKGFVNRAVTLNGTRVRFGTEMTVTETIVRKYGLPETELGKSIISFAVMDKRPRETTKPVAAK